MRRLRKSPNAYRRMLPGLFWIAVPLLAVFFLLVVLDLRSERRELEWRRNQIEIAWVNVERDLSERALLAMQLVESAQNQPDRSPSPRLREGADTMRKSLSRMEDATARAEVVEANLGVERAMRRFLAVLRSDRQMGGNPEVRRTQEEILAIENRLALDRTSYNEAVQRFNTRLALFPSNLTAAVFGIERYRIYVPTDLRHPASLPPDAPRVSSPNPPDRREAKQKDR